MKRVKFNVVDYKEKPINIDYSELVTEPHQVLSMREIYQRYVAMGVDPLKGELIDDDEDLEQSVILDPEIDDKLDLLHEMDQQRHAGARKQRSASRAAEQAKPADDQDEEKDERKQSDSEDETKS